MNTIKTRLTTEGAFEIDHELAGIVPMATPAEQATLTENIKEFGQKEPIVLWHGKVVDGRCRQKALVALDRHIMYKELDDSTSKEDVEIYVKAVNTRRNLTSSQKVAIACREYLKNRNNSTQLKVAKAWGISDRILKNALWLHALDPSIMDTIFDGGSVDVVDKAGLPTKSNKITTIYAYYKKKEEDVVEVTDHAWKENGSIKTQAGKDWYYRFVASKNLDVESRMAIAELANFKFPNKEDSTNEEVQ